MRRRLHPQLSFANVVSVIALFVALGGAAYAGGLINGKNIQRGTVKGAQVNEASLRVVCPKRTIKLGDAHVRAHGDVCFGPDQAAADWDVAARDCASEKLRLPTIAEALLITNMVDRSYIWTDEFTLGPNQRMVVRTNDTGFSRIASVPKGGPYPYNCVSTPR